MESTVKQHFQYSSNVDDIFFVGQSFLIMLVRHCGTEVFDVLKLCF
jgi:hypothetical protein